MHSSLRAFGRLILTISFLLGVAQSEQISFKRAIELALRHSGTLSIAQAEQTRTYQNYIATRANYIPSVTLGSGLGYSFGVPLTIEGATPSLFNINTAQSVLNFALKEQIKASKIEWNASQLDMLDKKNGVILDTAIAYMQLDSAVTKLKVLREALVSAQKAEFISTERVKVGLDSELDLKKTKLSRARIQLRIAEAETQCDVLRERLSKLTGIPPDSFDTVTESLPRTPDVPQDPAIAREAAENNPAVKGAFERAKSAELRAQAEHKQLLPSFDLAGQYALLSQTNNYESFYTKFERNNYTIGLNIRFPFFNRQQHALAAAADADAIKFQKTAEGIRNDVQANNLQLLRGLRELAAAREVARLEYEVAQAGVDAMQAKIQSGQASERDAEQAKLDANDRYATYLDANFDLFRAQVQMLRATGEIQRWALGQ